MTAVFTHVYALVALGRVTGTAFSQQAQVSHRVLEVSPPQGNQSNIGVCGDSAWSSPLAFSSCGQHWRQKSILSTKRRRRLERDKSTVCDPSASRVVIATVRVKMMIQVVAKH